MTKIENRLSLVVPVYNRAALIDRLLTSMSSHTVLPAHIVLVDNNSTDDSVKVLHHHAKLLPTKVTVANCRKRGAAAARNAGLALVDTPWVMFFDSDDEIGPRHFENISTALSIHPDIDIFGWDCPSDRGLCRFFDRDAQRRCLFNGGMATQRWSARTELVRQAGEWNEDVFYWNDIELGCRMLSLTSKVKHIGTADVYLHYEQESITAAGSKNPSASDTSLMSIEATLTKIIGVEKAKFWIALKRAVEYANLRRSKSNRKSFKELDNLLKNCMMQFDTYKKTLLTIAYQSTLHGIRGAWMLSYFVK